jgi:hypothetical protein
MVAEGGGAFASVDDAGSDLTSCLISTCIASSPAPPNIAESAAVSLQNEAKVRSNISCHNELRDSRSREKVARADEKVEKYFGAQEKKNSGQSLAEVSEARHWKLTIKRVSQLSFHSGLNAFGGTWRENGVEMNLFSIFWTYSARYR